MKIETMFQAPLLPLNFNIFLKAITGRLILLYTIKMYGMTNYDHSFTYYKSQSNHRLESFFSNHHF
jgi:hypothetical protein